MPGWMLNELERISRSCNGFDTYRWHPAAAKLDGGRMPPIHSSETRSSCIPSTCEQPYRR